MIRDAIFKLVDGHPLDEAEAQSVMQEIMSGEASDAQIAAYLTALRIRGETPAVIAGSARAMSERCTPVAAASRVVVDIVGTGGDGAHTINISTAAAFVAAGAGITVAKHGNRSVSSRCGSADVLEALGVRINAPPERISRCLDQVGLAFLFAPLLHPAMKHAIGPRRELAMRTIFNILGPLCNPAAAQYGVLGVYADHLVETIAHAAASLGFRHFFVVHGRDGLDEITTTTTTHIGEVRDQSVRHYELDPAEFGIGRCAPEALRGADPEANAVILRRVLDGEPGPQRDVVLLNAAVAIVAGRGAADIPAGLEAAARSIDSGAARGKLQALVEQTNQG